MNANAPGSFSKTGSAYIYLIKGNLEIPKWTRGVESTNDTRSVLAGQLYLSCGQGKTLTSGVGDLFRVLSGAVFKKPGTPTSDSRVPASSCQKVYVSIAFPLTPSLSPTYPLRPTFILHGLVGDGRNTNPKSKIPVSPSRLGTSSATMSSSE